MRTSTPIYRRGLKLVFTKQDDGIHYELFSETKDMSRSFPIESGLYENNENEIFARHQELMNDIPVNQHFDPSVMIEKERGR